MAAARETSEVIARRADMDRRTKPSRDYREMSERLAKRQSIGGDAPIAANDNQAWPLAEQLRREGNDVLLKVARRYRRIYDAAHTEVPLIGTQQDETFMPVEQRYHLNEATGEYKRKGARSAKSAMPVSDGTSKVEPVTDAVQGRISGGDIVTFPWKPGKPVMKKWSGDNIIIEAIDCRAIIRHLQSALGPLCETFEDAVLHGETLSAIGERKGVTPQKSGAAGKVLVMMGLEVVQAELAAIDRATAS